MFQFGSPILHANNPLKNVSKKFSKMLSTLIGNFANKVAYCIL